MEELRGEAYRRFWCGNLRERDRLGNPCVDGRIITFGSLGSGMCEYGLNHAVSGYGQVADICELGNEICSSSKYGDMLNNRETISFSCITVLLGV
jgi:hypothetical protein